MLVATCSTQSSPVVTSAFRSVMVPFDQTNACLSPLATSAVPTTTPLLLTSYAAAEAPPSVPRSVIPPVGVQRNARDDEEDELANPTTWPPLLMLRAKLMLPPERNPSSLTPPPCQMAAW